MGIQGAPAAGSTGYRTFGEAVRGGAIARALYAVVKLEDDKMRKAGFAGHLSPEQIARNAQIAERAKKGEVPKTASLPMRGYLRLANYVRAIRSWFDPKPASPAFHNWRNWLLKAKVGTPLELKDPDRSDLTPPPSQPPVWKRLWTFLAGEKPETPLEKQLLPPLTQGEEQKLKGLKEARIKDRALLNDLEAAAKLPNAAENADLKFATERGLLDAIIDALRQKNDNYAERAKNLAATGRKWLTTALRRSTWATVFTPTPLLVPGFLSLLHYFNHGPSDASSVLIRGGCNAIAGLLTIALQRLSERAIAQTAIEETHNATMFAKLHATLNYEMARWVLHSTGDRMRDDRLMVDAMLHHIETQETNHYGNRDHGLTRSAPKQTQEIEKGKEGGDAGSLPSVIVPATPATPEAVNLAQIPPLQDEARLVEEVDEQRIQAIFTSAATAMIDYDVLARIGSVELKTGSNRIHNLGVWPPVFSALASVFIVFLPPSLREVPLAFAEVASGVLILLTGYYRHKQVIAATHTAGEARKTAERIKHTMLREITDSYPTDNRPQDDSLAAKLDWMQREVAMAEGDYRQTTLGRG